MKKTNTCIKFTKQLTTLIHRGNLMFLRQYNKYQSFKLAYRAAFLGYKPALDLFINCRNQNGYWNRAEIIALTNQWLEQGINVDVKCEYVSIHTQIAEPLAVESEVQILKIWAGRGLINPPQLASANCLTYVQ